MKEKPRCASCGDANILYVKRNKSFWCRRCGHEWEAKKEEAKKEK
ncbi:MAG: hypothetical protein DDT23_00952 [candidate division WS2 bacterium]|nr:hypothetical protein [Candidatus Lithacetigena glycinireducens]